MINAKVKKLAQEIGISFGGHPMNPLSVYPSDLQKLVELVVKESIGVMAEHDYHAEWLGEKIKEHFGVEK
jgi:hypothetical protein